MRQRNAQTPGGRSTLLGYNRVCDCGCGRSFPASRSSKGQSRRWYDPEYCPRRFRNKNGRTKPSAKGKAPATLVESDAVVYRKLPYNKIEECLRDNKGRECTCKHYAGCADKHERGEKTALEIRMVCGIRRHCYEPSEINCATGALSHSACVQYRKNSGAKRGAE